jgi:hypothetical protein
MHSKSQILGARTPVRWRTIAAVPFVLLLFGAGLLRGDQSSPGDAARYVLRPITEIQLDVSLPQGEAPEDLAASVFEEAGTLYQPSGSSRPWPLYVFWWEAPATCHQPLYFEEVNLERYGYRHGLAQPVLSAAHFFGTVPALPYLIAAEPPRECVYTLGHYRPGSAAPYRIHYPPLSLKGALAEAGVLTGLFLVIP